MKVLVTGAAGFVGSYLAQRLINRNYDVRLIDNYYLPSNLTEVEGVPIERRDIRDTDLDLADLDILVHCGAIAGIKACQDNPEEANDVNVRGVYNLIKRLSDKCRVIFPSSSAIYGVCQESSISETHPTEPRNVYGQTKLDAEAIVKLHGNYAILRFSNIYGHALFHKRTVTDLFIERALKKAPIDIHGSGTQRRDFVHVNDVIRSYVLAMESRANDTYNIGGNEALSINDIAELVVKNYRKVFGWTLDVNHIPIDEGVKWRDFVYDSRKAREALRYEPSYSISDEIKERFNCANSRSLRG